MNRFKFSFSFASPVQSSMLARQKGYEKLLRQSAIEFNRIGTVGETTCASIELKKIIIQYLKVLSSQNIILP